MMYRSSDRPLEHRPIPDKREHWLESMATCFVLLASAGAMVLIAIGLGA